MICPQCKAEYRQGFTVCADCEVPLVAELPAASGPSSESAASDQIAGPVDDPFCAFWNGDDPRIHAELCGLLDEQGIPHKTVRRADHLFNLNSKSAFQVGIPFSFFEKAEAAIKDAYGADEEIQPASRLLPPGTDHLPGTRKGLTWFDDRLRSARADSDSHPELAVTALSEEPSSWEKAAVSHADWDPQNWYPEDATVEVWSGDQPELCEMIAASLQENQIHCRLNNPGDKCVLFVLPNDKTRAHEIVREIIEGAPPELC
jgi:hypothetical protein